MKTSKALVAVILALVAGVGHAQLVSGDSVTAIYGGYIYSTPDGGYSGPPQDSVGTVGGNPLAASFFDQFGDNWSATTTFTNGTFQLTFLSPNYPVGANIQSSGPLFTVDYQFGSSVVGNYSTSLASYYNIVPGSVANGSSLLQISTANPHDVSLSFNALFAGDQYTFQITPVPEPGTDALLAAGILLLGFVWLRGARRGERIVSAATA